MLSFDVEIDCGDGNPLRWCLLDLFNVECRYLVIICFNWSVSNDITYWFNLLRDADCVAFEHSLNEKTSFLDEIVLASVLLFVAMQTQLVVFAQVINLKKSAAGKSEKFVT